MKSEMYGSTPIGLRTKVTYIATIINCPWARLMIPMTPMMRVIPIPIRAYSPPLRTPATRVCRKTSILISAGVHVPVHDAEDRRRAGRKDRPARRRRTGETDSKDLTCACPSSESGRRTVFVATLFGQTASSFAVLPLDHVGVELVLLGLLPVGDELDRPEDGLHVRRGQGVPNVLRGKALRPLQGVGDDLHRRVRLGAVVLGLDAVFLLEIVVVLLGPRVRQRLEPQGRGIDALGRGPRVLGELGKGESGPAADEQLGVDPELLGLTHQQRGVHDVGHHVDHVGVRRLDLGEDRLEVDRPAWYPSFTTIFRPRSAQSCSNDFELDWPNELFS